MLTVLAPLLGDLLDRAFPDSGEREHARLELHAKMQEQLQALDVAQMEVNKQEAQHASVLVAGWRPFIGWTCGASFAYHYVAQPFLLFCFAAAEREVPLP